MKETLTFEKRSFEEAREILEEAYKGDRTACWYGNFRVNGSFVNGLIEKDGPASPVYREQLYKVTVEYDLRNTPYIGDNLKKFQ